MFQKLFSRVYLFQNLTKLSLEIDKIKIISIYCMRIHSLTNRKFLNQKMNKKIKMKTNTKHSKKVKRKNKKKTINFAGPPVEVGVTMYVLSISSLSEVKMVQIRLRNFYFSYKIFTFSFILIFCFRFFVDLPIKQKYYQAFLFDSPSFINQLKTITTKSFFCNNNKKIIFNFILTQSIK